MDYVSIENEGYQKKRRRPASDQSTQAKFTHSPVIEQSCSGRSRVFGVVPVSSMRISIADRLHSNHWFVRILIDLLQNGRPCCGSAAPGNLHLRPIPAWFCLRSSCRRIRPPN